MKLPLFLSSSWIIEESCVALDVTSSSVISSLLLTVVTLPVLEDDDSVERLKEQMDVESEGI